MLKKDRDIALRIKEELSRQVALVDVRVFGSRARGTADAGSDLDLFIEVESMGMGKHIHSLFDSRQEGDYKEFCDVTRDDALNSLEKATEFIHTLQQLQ